MPNKSKKKRTPVSQTRGTKPIHRKNINEKKFEAKRIKRTLQMLKNKKQVLREENENGLLSEKNIKPQE